MFYRDADAGIVVFDVTDQSTFVKCNQWISELRQARGSAVKIFVAGNKSDLHSVRTMPLESANDLAATHGGKCFFTSAKTGENIDLLFGTVAKELSLKPPPPEGPASTPKRRSTVRFDQVPEQKEGCC
jgi:GTPase SAR1 family protein